MKYLLLLSCLISASVYALEPSNTLGVSDDTFINYQWAIHNDGQKLSRDTDDIHPILAESKPGYDLQWKELHSLLKSKNRKETVIAVIDSGLSDSHDDIKGNTLPGQNFMARNDAMKDDTSDDIGHGTHVAGVIAAHINNANGIAGLADQIKILPLKVYSSKKELEQRSFIERVAKAIVYATEKKVDVINLSLGWPLVIDLPVVQDAIQKALAQNITIVAGAGNDGHALKVLPCSYKEVICVGAMGINGDIPNFSNYGGQVDIIAPGEAILSLWPALLMPKNFGLRKYNIVSGTSQATPYVSAAAAILKSVYHNISNDEIKARLFASSKNDLVWTGRYALNGLLQPASAIKAQAQSVIRPIFKNLDQVYVNPQSNEFAFVLPIKNYWQNSGAIQIQITSSDENIQLQSQSFSIASLKSGQESNLNIRGKTKSLLGNNEISFVIKIQYQGKTETYLHKSTLALKSDLVSTRSYKGLPELISVTDIDNKNKNAEFYNLKKLEKGIDLSIYRFSGNQLSRVNTIFIPNAVGLYPHLGVVRQDINLDGSDDYFVSVIVKENDEQKIRHLILNKDMNFALGQNSEWNLKDEGILIHQPTLSFVRWNSVAMGSISVPIFWSQGPIPEADKNPDPFERKESVGKGLFYFTPVVVNGKVELTTRLLNNEANTAQIRKKLKARFDEELKLMHFSVKNQSKVQVLMSLGIASILKYYIAEFDLNSSDIKIQDLNLPSMDLGYHATKKLDEDRIAFFGIYKNDLGRLAILNTKTLDIQSYELQSNSLENGIVSLLAVKEDAIAIDIFVEGVESFILYKINKSNGSTEKFISPINRFSYLPGQFFSDILHSVNVQDGMSLYVDSSMINSKNIHISSAGKSGITSPIRYSIELPSNCSALNPRKVYEQDPSISYIFLCKEGGSFTLKTHQL